MTYQFLPSMLLNEVQKQQRKIENQAAEMTRQQQIIAWLEQDRHQRTAEMSRQGQIIADLQVQTARIAELERERQILKAAMAETAELKQQTAHLARLLNQQQRTGAVTAGLGLQ